MEIEIRKVMREETIMQQEECKFEDGEENNGGQVDDLSVEEVFKMTFESEEGAESFYSLCSMLDSRSADDLIGS